MSDELGEQSLVVVDTRPFVYITKEQESNLKKWIKALRSEDYKQHRGALYNYNETAYCCIGVASVITKRYVGVRLHYPDLEKQFAILDTNGDCIKMNDEELLSFVQIAEVLEDYLFLVQYANLYENTIPDGMVIE